jgi:23S rRNA pseudouridine1911/1915/1917 synthase
MGGAYGSEVPGEKFQVANNPSKGISIGTWTFFLGTSVVRAVCEFRVIDESSDWIVVDKPAPLAVHPANGRFDEPTLLSGLRQLLSYELANGAGLSIMTRLDRETSGLVLVAKNRVAARHFSLQLERREVEKEYLAIVHGWPEWHEERVEGAILRAGEVGESVIWLRQRVHSGGRACATRFRVERRIGLAGGGCFALIHCFPETGRMHQIRVHLEHAGHPLVGDKIYGHDGTPYLEKVDGGLSDESVARLILPRHALHATRLVADWDGKRIEWQSQLPEELARFASAR